MKTSQLILPMIVMSLFSTLVLYGIEFAVIGLAVSLWHLIASAPHPLIQIVQTLSLQPLEDNFAHVVKHLLLETPTYVVMLNIALLVFVGSAFLDGFIRGYVRSFATGYKATSGTMPPTGILMISTRVAVITYVCTNISALTVLMAYLTSQQALSSQHGVIASLAGRFFEHGLTDFRTALMYWCEQLGQTICLDIPSVYGFHLSNLQHQTANFAAATIVSSFKLLIAGGLLRALAYSVDLKLTAPA